MFDTDNEIISYALEVWGNYIETFSVSMSAKDRKDRESNTPLKDYVTPNFLSTEQKKLVERIRTLSEQYKDPCFKCDEPSSIPCKKCEQYERIK